MEERLAALAGGAPAEAGDADMEWPDDTEESAFLSESASRGEPAAPLAGRAAIQVTGDKLPALDELVAKVPPQVAALLDELFRAKFTGVRKIAEVSAAAAVTK